MYSSLARSQARKPPRLHVYKDTPDVIPLETPFGTEVGVITYACYSYSFPANVYTNVGRGRRFHERNLMPWNI